MFIGTIPKGFITENMRRNNYDYLRISVTDRCNLNCVYCSPLENFRKLVHDDLLNYEEIVRFVEIMSRLGITRIRLTGGEPLVRRNIVYLIKELKGLSHIEEVSLTTNGIMFCELAYELKGAGLDRVNISLDTLRPDRYFNITGKDRYNDVWRAVLMAIKLDFEPVKINTVLFKGINDDEIMDFVELTKGYPISVRFIEYMDMQDRGDYISVSNEDVLKGLKGRYKLKECMPGPKGAGPSRYFTIDGSNGYIGFISPNSEYFCDSCNRFRLLSDGKLHPCLFSSRCLDIRDMIRSNMSDEEIKKEVERFISEKHRYTRMSENYGGVVRNECKSTANNGMAYIGG